MIFLHAILLLKLVYSQCTDNEIEIVQTCPLEGTIPLEIPVKRDVSGNYESKTTKRGAKYYLNPEKNIALFKKYGTWYFNRYVDRTLPRVITRSSGIFKAVASEYEIDSPFEVAEWEMLSMAGRHQYLKTDCIKVFKPDQCKIKLMMKEDWRAETVYERDQLINVTISLMTDDARPEVKVNHVFKPQITKGREFNENIYYDCPDRRRDYRLSSIREF